MSEEIELKAIECSREADVLPLRAQPRNWKVEELEQVKRENILCSMTGAVGPTTMGWW